MQKLSIYNLGLYLGNTTLSLCFFPWVLLYETGVSLQGSEALLRQQQNFTKPATQIKEYTKRKAEIKRSKQLHPGKCPKGSSYGNGMLQKRCIHGVAHSVPEQVALRMESWGPGSCFEIPGSLTATHPAFSYHIL